MDEVEFNIHILIIIIKNRVIIDRLFYPGIEDTPIE